MLRSMTGFGDAQLETDGTSFLVEVKSLNNRFLKTSIKLPDLLSFAEPQIDRIIRKSVSRGSVSYWLHMRHTADKGPFEVNQAAVKHYMASLDGILTLNGKRDGLTIDLATLLQLPGSCQLREYTEAEHKHMLEIVQELTEKAIEKLGQMRLEEGKSLLADLQHNCEQIRDRLEMLVGMTDSVVDRYHQRLKQRVNAMLTGANINIDQEILAKEVALFAERADINEEKNRLESHLGQFSEVCLSDEQAGRRLEFLTQEMLREANTISSKANDATISQYVVEIKVAIDRLKEQVQNVE